MSHAKSAHSDVTLKTFECSYKVIIWCVRSLKYLSGVYRVSNNVFLHIINNNNISVDNCNGAKYRV